MAITAHTDTTNAHGITLGAATRYLMRQDQAEGRQYWNRTSREVRAFWAGFGPEDLHAQAVAESTSGGFGYGATDDLLDWLQSNLSNPKAARMSPLPNRIDPEDEYRRALYDRVESVNLSLRAAKKGRRG